MDKLKKLKRWHIAVIVIFVVFLASGGLDIETEQPPVETNDQTIVEAQEASLADRVDEQYKENWGIESYTSFLLSEDYPPESIVGYINKFEDVSRGVVRVHVQTDATEDEAKGLALNVLGMVGFDIEELQWVVVRGVDGRDYQASRNDIPALR
jgi:hypothetical protein